jgi:hypothetical protein
MTNSHTPDDHEQKLFLRLHNQVTILFNHLSYPRKFTPICSQAAVVVHSPVNLLANEEGS